MPLEQRLQDIKTGTETVDSLLLSLFRFNSHAYLKVYVPKRDSHLPNENQDLIFLLEHRFSWD